MCLYGVRKVREGTRRYLPDALQRTPSAVQQPPARAQASGAQSASPSARAAPHAHAGCRAVNVSLAGGSNLLSTVTSAEDKNDDNSARSGAPVHQAHRFYVSTAYQQNKVLGAKRLTHGLTKRAARTSCARQTTNHVSASLCQLSRVIQPDLARSTSPLPPSHLDAAAAIVERLRGAARL